jgi:hypothetical protein
MFESEVLYQLKTSRRGLVGEILFFLLEKVFSPDKINDIGVTRLLY